MRIAQVRWAVFFSNDRNGLAPDKVSQDPSAVADSVPTPFIGSR